MNAVSASAVFLAVWAVLSVPRFAVHGSTGLDASWVWGINLWGSGTFVFGRDIAFTYGPASALLRPAPVGEHVFWAVVFRILLNVAIGAGVWLLLSPRHSRGAQWLGVLVPLGTVVLLAPEVDQLCVFAVLLWAGVVLEREWKAAAVALGVYGALLFFMKFSSGMAAASVLGPLALVLWFLQRRIESLILVVTVAAATLILGVAFTHGLSALGSYFRLSAEFASGYTSVMSTDGDTLAAMLGLVVVFCELVALVAYWRWQHPARWYTSLLVIPQLLGFKHAFLRQDLGHVISVYDLAAFTCCIAFCVAQSLRQRALALLGCGVIFLSLALSVPLTWWEDSTRATTEGLAGGSLSWLQDQLFHRKAALRRTSEVTALALVPDHLPDHLRQLIPKQASVMVVPWEISICVENSLNCVPYPTLQMYATYTAALDRFTADEMRSRLPDFILAESGAIDGREMLWDCPSTWQVILENYEVLEVTRAPSRPIALLRRRGTPRQLNSSVLGRGRFKIGEWVPLPVRSPWLRARIDVRERWTGKVRRALLRPTEIHLEVRRANGQVETRRLVADTARGGIWIGSMAPDVPSLKAFMEHEGPASPVVETRVVVQEPDNAWVQRYSIEWADVTGA